MATVSDLLTFSRAQAQTDSNGLTDTNGIIWANEALTDFHRRLVKAGVDASSIQEAYRDASVPATGNGSTFLYPTDMLFLKAIEINYSDTSPNNYLRAEQVDHSNLQGTTSFSWLRVNASKQLPQFADNGDWFEVFPSFTGSDNLSQAIRIIYFQKPTEYTSTSSNISYPASLNYRMLGWRVCANYYKSLNKFTEALNFDAEYLKMVQDYIDNLSRGSQQPIQATLVDVASNGWNL